MSSICGHSRSQQALHCNGEAVHRVRVIGPRYRGAHTLEINLEPSQGSIFFDELRYGPAGVEVPKWVEELLAEVSPDTA